MNLQEKWEHRMRRLDELPPKVAWLVGLAVFLLLGVLVTSLPSWGFVAGLMGLGGVLVWLALSGEPVVQLPLLSSRAGGEEKLPPELPSLLPLKEPLEMIELGGGEFWMGSPEDEEQRFPDEVRHRVRVAAFAMAKHPVTQYLFASVEGASPSHFIGSMLPVEQVSWFEAVKFCNKLSEQVGLRPCYRITEASASKGEEILPQVEWDRGADGYRLPTEAEWEYACRAGTQTAYSFGEKRTQLGEHAWFADNSGQCTHEVGQKRPNAWGLHDLHGNVWEWCWDWYEDSKVTNDSDISVNPVGPAMGSRRVVRGGSFFNEPRNLRAAFRDWNQPEDLYWYLGFRCVRGSRRQR